MKTNTMFKWSGAALALALWAGCATDTKQSEPSGEDAGTPPPVVKESAPEVEEVAEEDDREATDEEVEAAIAEALGEWVPVLAEEGPSVTRTYFDTFDWRVRLTWVIPG